MPDFEEQIAIVGQQAHERRLVCPGIAIEGRQCLLVEGTSRAIVALDEGDVREILESLGDLRCVRAECLPSYLQRTLVEWLRRLQIVLEPVGVREIAQRLRHLRAARAKNLFADLQSGAKRFDRLFASL